MGFVICLASIVLFGLDGQKIDVRYFSLICHARALCISIGFSLSFGAMFTKIWISYRISTQMEHHGKNKVGNQAVCLQFDRISISFFHRKFEIRKSI